MKVRRIFSSDHQGVQIQVSGKVSDGHFMRYLGFLCRESEALQAFRKLIDFRAVASVSGLSVGGVTQFARLNKHRSESRTALLVLDNPVHYGMARVYQTLILQKNRNVEIFKCPTQARKWLNG